MQLSQLLEKRESELQLEKQDNVISKQNVAEMAVVVAEYEKTLAQLIRKSISYVSPFCHRCVWGV